MIKNERQYAVTRSWVKKFEAAIADMDLELAGGADKIMMAERTGLQSKADEMKGDIAEYEALKSGRVPHVDVGNLEELPEALIKMRIGLGLTQRELAERMGIREQQVQRYEHTDYESAGYARLMEVHAALSSGAARWTGCEDVPNDAHVLSRIKIAGLKGRFVDDCIVGRPRARGENKAEAAAYERKLLSRLHKIYGWSPDQLLGGAPLETDPAQARFKIPAGADHAVVHAHAVYARYMAGILARASGGRGGERQRSVQGDLYRLRKDLEGGDRAITFAGLVEYAWEMGIAVGHLPPLAFHAAYFNMEGTGVIMLASGEASESRLMFDLAHEMYHAGKGRDSIDVDEGDTSAEETEASRFAHAVLVGPGADRMFKACMDGCTSGGGDAPNIAMLKQAVSEAALEEDVRADSLANYVARRLMRESICDWRGTAQNMQKRMPEWRDIVASAIGSHADIVGMSEPDFDLLSDVMQVRHR